jgi:hypothetical protein
MRKILVLVAMLLMTGFSYAQMKPQGETLNFPAIKYPTHPAYQSKMRRAPAPEDKVIKTNIKLPDWGRKASVDRLPQQRDFAPRKAIRKTYRPQQVYYYSASYTQPYAQYDTCSYNYQQQYPWVTSNQTPMPICVSCVQRVCTFPFDILSLLFGGQ